MPNQSGDSNASLAASGSTPSIGPSYRPAAISSAPLLRLFAFFLRVLAALRDDARLPSSILIRSSRSEAAARKSSTVRLTFFGLSSPFLEASVFETFAAVFLRTPRDLSSLLRPLSFATSAPPVDCAGVVCPPAGRAKLHFPSPAVKLRSPASTFAEGIPVSRSAVKEWDSRRGPGRSRRCPPAMATWPIAGWSGS